MPKKTKREKIIAEYRRKRDEFIRETVPTPTPYVYQAKSSASSNTTAFQPMDQAIRRDLIKTLILASIAIGGEVALAMILPAWS